jgi:hypothetical protein
MNARVRSCVILLAAGLGSLVQFARSQPSAPNPAGTIDFVAGPASVVAGSGARTGAASGAVVHEGDSIETAAGGEVHLKMEDGGYLAVRPATRVKITAYRARAQGDDRSALFLFGGALRSITGWIGRLNPRAYRIQTVTATIGIRGTDHETIQILSEIAAPGEIAGTHDRVNRGATVLEHEGRQISVEQGRAGYASADGKLALHEKIPAYLDRHTANEVRVERYSKNIEKHINERLREAREAHKERGESRKELHRQPHRAR